jgi:hypothetical protein
MSGSSGGRATVTPPPIRGNSCQRHPDLALTLFRDVAGFGVSGDAGFAALSSCSSCDLEVLSVLFRTWRPCGSSGCSWLGVAAIERRLGYTAVAGREVVIQLRVRRFSCAGACGKKIFVEQVPGLTIRNGRVSTGLREVLRAIALDWINPACRTAFGRHHSRDIRHSGIGMPAGHLGWARTSSHTTHAPPGGSMGAAARAHALVTQESAAVSDHGEVPAVIGSRSERPREETADQSQDKFKPTTPVRSCPCWLSQLRRSCSRYTVRGQADSGSGHSGIIGSGRADPATGGELVPNTPSCDW